MNIQNATSIDSQVFQYVMEHSLPLLGKGYYSDLYYSACHIHRIFKTWSMNSDLEFYLIVRRDRLHLMNDKYNFNVKRQTLFTHHEEDYLCFEIIVKRSNSGWVLVGNQLSNN